MKIVLDTNVIIASFAARGLCHAVFELCLDRFEIVASPFLIKEVETNILKKLVSFSVVGYNFDIKVLFLQGN